MVFAYHELCNYAFQRQIRDIRRCVSQWFFLLRLLAIGLRQYCAYWRHYSQCSFSAGARLMCNGSKYYHISPLLRDLHQPVCPHIA